MNKKKFETEITIVIILNIFFYFYYLFEKWSEIEAAYHIDKNIFNGFYLISIEFIIFSLLLFIYLIVFELFMRGVVEKKNKFNPIKYLLTNKKYFYYNFMIFVLVYLVLLLIFAIFKNIFIALINSDGNGRLIKTFMVFLFFGSLYILFRNVFFKKNFEKIGFNKYFEISGKDLGDQYDLYYFNYRISNLIIFLLIVEVIATISTSIILDVKNHFNLFVFHYCFFNSIYFLYSFVYLNKKNLTRVFSLICYLPFGFIYLMFIPAKYVDSDDLAKKILL